ncbi:MAG: hypothetical protein Kow0065_08770 [Methylomicrobium sp.]
MLNNFYFKSVLLAASLMSMPLWATSALAEEKFQRNLMMEHQVQLPSNTVNAKTIKVTIPAGFKTPDHTHDGPGPRYVVKGKLKVVEGGKEGVYSAGEVFWETGGLMSVENIGKDAAELIIFELAPSK